MPRPSTARGTVIGVAAADGLCGFEFSEIHRIGDTNSCLSGLRLIRSATSRLNEGVIPEVISTNQAPLYPKLGMNSSRMKFPARSR